MERKFKFVSKHATYIKQKMDKIFLSADLLFLLKEKIVQHKLNEIKKPKEGKPKTISEKCNSRWNVCLQVLQNNIFHSHTYENYVFRLNADVKPISNYL